MTNPEPSKAVVGDVASSSVAKYDLLFQSPAAPSQSVKRDSDQSDLTQHTVSYVDGATVLRFQLPVAFLQVYLDDSPTLWLLWAHGSVVSPQPFPSYHVGIRGAVPVSRQSVFGESAKPSPPSVTNDGEDGCSCSNQQINYCDESISYQVASCYISDSSLTPTEFNDADIKEYDFVQQLSNEFRIAWTTTGAYPSGEIKIMMQARTLGWLAIGLLRHTTDDGAAAGNGMIDADIYIGNVV